MCILSAFTYTVLFIPHLKKWAFRTNFLQNAYLLTLPTAKAGGFLFLPLLHWLIPHGIATSYTVSTS